MTPEAIDQAYDALEGKVARTPLVHSPTLSRMFGAEIHLKLENLQKTGSFKIRGATYKIASVREAAKKSGVVAASAGNHAQGVALAATAAGIQAHIVMPEWASITKQEATRNYGGNVIIHGETLEQSLEKARSMADGGAVLIHPFDDGQIIAGQGTIAREILEQLPDADLIIVPVGGGGLISGIASYVGGKGARARVVGVEAEACPSASTALREGSIRRVEAVSSIADGISVKQIGGLNFTLLQKWVEEVALVSERHIAAAILLLLERKKILAEGSGAAPLAGLLSGGIKPKKGEKVVLVISGGNVDSPLLGRIISQGLIKHGRVMQVRVLLRDAPGSLAHLLATVAEHKANVLHIQHKRNVPDLPINITRVELELETTGPEHIDQVLAGLKKTGFSIRPMTEC